MENGIPPEDRFSVDNEQKKSFRFGDDAIEESSGVLSLETQLLGKEVTYQTHTVNGGAPWLGSIHFLERCNATINFKTGLAYFPELNAEELVYLKKMSSGHLGLALNDDGTAHQKVPLGDDIVTLLAKLSEEQGVSSSSSSSTQK